MTSRASKRKCFLCNEDATQSKRFPPLSRPLSQKEWILRQNMGDEGTTELLERHRSAKDPRWCIRHFTSAEDDLPTDNRPVPVRPLTLPTEPLRTTRPADLVPPSYFNRSPSFDNSESGMYSQQVPSSPSVSEAIRGPAWSSPVALDDRYDYDSCNYIDQVLPKRFKSDVSTNTMETVQAEDSDYRCSQLTSSQGEEEEEIDEEKDEGGKKMGRYVIVEEECLLRLFERCGECGQRLDKSTIEMKRTGSARVVTYDCLGCNKNVVWESQNKIGKKRDVFSANHSIPIASFITGTPLPRLLDFANLIDLDLPSDRTMRKSIRDIGSVAIERVYEEWQEMVREVAVNASQDDGLQISIDGQYSKPGYNAPNCKVTVIDCETRLAIAGVAMHTKQEGIEGVSCRMESEGALRAIVELVDAGIKIRTRVGDQNAMVNKKLSENPKTKHIDLLNDWWHVQKPMRREWWKIVKANPELAPIYQYFFTHLYHVHHKYPAKEDRAHALEVVRSFVNHIQGKHRWTKGDDFKLIDKCEHGRLKKLKKGEKRLSLKADSEVLELVRTLVFAKRFEKAFMNAASLIDTAINECYHSLSLMYSAKRFACSHLYYRLKMKVAMLHYNNLMLDDLLGTRTEVGSTVLSRKGRVVPAFKRKRGQGSHSWRDQVMEESLVVREELSEARAVKRIGIPEDDVFDDLNDWWEEKEKLRLNAGYDFDQGEENSDDGSLEDDEEEIEL